MIEIIFYIGCGAIGLYLSKIALAYLDGPDAPDNEPDIHLLYVRAERRCSDLAKLLKKTQDECMAIVIENKRLRRSNAQYKANQ